MSVVPSLDITHDHWDDAAGRPFAVSPAVAPPMLEGRPASQAPHVAGAGASVASLSYLEPAPPKPSLLSVGESQYEDSEKLVIQKLSMPAASARPLASAHPSLDDDDEPEDVLAITGSATDAPLGTTRVDSEEMPMPPPKPRLQLAPVERPGKPLADADDPNVDMPSSQMPMLPKPRPVPVSVSVSVATRRKSHDTAGQSTRKKARKADAEKAEADEDDEEAPAPQEVVVDGSISEEPEQSDNNSNGSGSSKSSAAASTATGTSSTLSKLFKGFSFLLTGMGEPEPPRPPRREVTYEEPASQMTQSQAPPKRPEPVAESEVLRGEVRVLIESTGGMIVDKVPDKAKPLTLPFGQISSVILLASRPARTQKYLSALLHGVPTVRYTWLKHCLELGCIISPKPYILPAGTSLETGVDLVHTKHVPDILLDVRIELSGTPEMQRVWGELLRVAGARVLLDGLLKGRTVDVLLVARNPLGIGTWVAPEVLHQARKKGIPAVTTEWVIQCIVNQKRVPFNRPEYIFSGGADS